MMRRVVLQRVRDAGRAAVAPGGVCGRGDEFDEGAVSGDVGMGGEWESREICDVEGESGGSVIECDGDDDDDDDDITNNITNNMVVNTITDNTITNNITNNNITNNNITNNNITDNNITNNIPDKNITNNNITNNNITNNNITDNNITNNITNTITNNTPTPLPDTNSTGLISSIRRRLSATLPDTLDDTLDDALDDALDATPDLELISNDAYNSVSLSLPSHAASSHPRLQRGSPRHHAARVPAAGPLLDAAARAGRYDTGGDLTGEKLLTVGETFLRGQVAVLLLSATATV